MLDQCPACRLPAPPYSFCAGCREDFRERGPGCRFCGMPVPYQGGICGQCLQRTPYWDQLFFVQDYVGPWAALIRRFKYSAAVALARPMAALLADTGVVHGHDWQVVAMPMHSSRLSERGFNQAALLADALADRQCLPRRQPLYRVSATPALEGRNRAERRNAVRHAFASEPAAGHWLLVDDVFTTGASAEAAVSALRSAGADCVALAMLARTPLSEDSRHNPLLTACHGIPGAGHG